MSLLLPDKKILIFQSSPPHTASTLLVNALYGLFEELQDKFILFDYRNEPTVILDYKIETEFADKNIVIVKTHNTNIEKLTSLYKDKYELFFVCSQRIKHNLFIDRKYLNYPNVDVFHYSELNETQENTLSDIIDNIYNRVYRLLSKYDFIKLNKEGSYKRVNNMNQMYNEIKENPFSYIDLFYHIHGSHRNR